MTTGLDTILYPVTDIEQAKKTFGALLGADPYVDESYYVAFRAGEGVDVGLDPGGHGRGMTGATPFWNTADIRGTVQSLTDAGGETLEDVRDVGGGKLIALVKTADGNVIGLAQPPA